MSYFAHSSRLPEWVVQVPEGWGSKWLKWSVDLSTKRPTEEEQAALPYISNEDIASWTGKLLVKEPQPAETDSRTFQENDVLFNKLRPYLAKVYHATFDGVSSGELLCLRPSHAVEPRFLFYVLVSKGFIDTINAEAFGAKMPRADWEIVGHQPLPLPSLETQRRIARFLDEKTARIDGLIEKKQELLNRLTEKRQALITRAVTQGLNPGGPLKSLDIGVRRGDRPVAEGVTGMKAHDWETWKLSHAYSRIGSGTTPTSSDARYYTDSDGTPWVTTAELRENYIFVTQQQVTEEALEDFPTLRMYRSGSVMMAMYGATIGRLGMIEVEATCNQACCVFEVSEYFDNRFLFYWLWHRRFDLISLSVGGGQPNLSQQDLREERILCPPLDAQRRIARFLDEKTSRINELIERIWVSIALLEEYRSAQITAAITGQLTKLR